MKYITTLFALLSLVLCIAIYHIKADVRQLDAQHTAIKKELAHTQQTIHMLEAEWTFLINPSVLEVMVKQHAPHLQPIPTNRLFSAEVLLAPDTSTKPVVADAGSTYYTQHTTTR